jgi:hypothetical protein
MDCSQSKPHFNPKTTTINPNAQTPQPYTERNNQRCNAATFTPKQYDQHPSLRIMAGVFNGALPYHTPNYSSSTIHIGSAEKLDHL